MNQREAARYRERSRATVVAAVERGGRIKAAVLPGRRGPALKAQVIEWVRPESIIYTDEWPQLPTGDVRGAATPRCSAPVKSGFQLA
jgi:hypothetical protein